MRCRSDSASQATRLLVTIAVLRPSFKHQHEDRTCPAENSKIVNAAQTGGPSPSKGQHQRQPGNSKTNQRHCTLTAAKGSKSPIASRFRKKISFRWWAVDGQTAPYGLLLLRPESPSRLGQLIWQSRPLRITWQDWIAPGGRIILHWSAGTGSILLRSVAAFHCSQHPVARRQQTMRLCRLCSVLASHTLAWRLRRLFGLS
jgi:hypothetical protein